MSWVLPSAAVTGNPIATSFGNDVIGDLTLLEGSLQVDGVQGTVSGSAPATTAPNFSIQCGTKVTTTGSSGTFTVTYPSAFTGIVGVTAMNLQNAGGHFWVEADTVNTSATSFQCMTSSSTNVGTSFPVTVFWIAIGWF